MFIAYSFPYFLMGNVLITLINNQLIVWYVNTSVHYRNYYYYYYYYHYHHHHHVQEMLGVFPVPWSSRWRWSLHLFLGRPMFLRTFFYIVVLVLVFYLCPSSVRVVATFSATVLLPLLCSVLSFFPPNTLTLFFSKILKVFNYIFSY